LLIITPPKIAQKTSQLMILKSKDSEFLTDLPETSSLMFSLMMNQGKNKETEIIEETGQSLTKASATKVTPWWSVHIVTLPALYGPWDPTSTVAYIK